MSSGRIVMGLMMVAGLWGGATSAAEPKAFAVPKTKAEWSARRAELVARIHAVVDPADSRSVWTIDLGSVELVNGINVQPLKLIAEGGRALKALIAWKPESGTSGQPGIVYLANKSDSGLLVGSDASPRTTLIELARRGMVAFWVENEVSLDDWRDPTRWPRVVSDDLHALNVLRSRPEVDASRVAVLGVGIGGTRAAWLMGLNETIKPGVAIGGMTRLSDWMKPHPQTTPPAWMASLVDGADLDAIVALSGGRTFEWTAGDRDSSSPLGTVAVIESVGKTMDRLVGDGHGFHVTRLGRQDAGYGRLQWLAATEIFEKAFVPLKPTPLDHAPEPEPRLVDPSLDVAANGLAGWVVEMSQRPGSWTWADGVISCKPGPNEYGWLRLPIEVDDFILTVEWKVQPRGNSGIFLRAQPVSWTFPPSATNKRIVSALALDWPSRTGLELQAQDDPGDANKFSSGSLYRHASPCANPTNPPGEWNRYTVRARGPRVEIWSNGTQVLDTEIDQYPLTLAHPPLKGYIGLQNHGAPAEFRGIKLQRLTR